MTHDVEHGHDTRQYRILICFWLLIKCRATRVFGSCSERFELPLLVIESLCNQVARVFDLLCGRIINRHFCCIYIRRKCETNKQFLKKNNKKNEFRVNLILKISIFMFELKVRLIYSY